MKLIWNNRYVCFMIVKLFKWCGSKLFTDEIEYYKDGDIQGVAYSSNLNLVADFRQLAIKRGIIKKKNI